MNKIYTRLVTTFFGTLSLIAAEVRSPYQSAERYQAEPPVVNLGGAAIAAYPPPAQLKADQRILETLLKDIHIQPGAAFGVSDDQNNPKIPVPTSDWWTHLLMNGDGGEHWAYPFVPRIEAKGIELRVVGEVDPNSRGERRRTTARMLVTARDNEGRPADLASARALRWSDWMVAFRKEAVQDATKSLDVTMARCMPYIWFDFKGVDPTLRFFPSAAGTTPAFYDADGQVITGDLGTREIVCVQLDNRYYGIHVAPGTRFTTASDGSLAVTLPPDKRYVVVSALPTLAHLSAFAKYAFAKPVKTTVNYRYDPTRPDGNVVSTHWRYEVEALRPGADTVFQGWLSPHYRDTRQAFQFLKGADFETPRGLLRCAPALASKGFEVAYPFNGVMSHLTAPQKFGLTNDVDLAYLKGLLEAYDAKEAGVAGDTYFGAKNLVLHARAMLMAKALGMTPTYLNLKKEIIASLSDWFTYQNGKPSKFFARNDRWGSLIGFPFVWDFNLGRFTDIHFHYGYYVLAYAVVAMDDPVFRDQYKEIAIELAKAYAEWERASSRYPWMRTFEPMVGHSYAGGESSGGGNNQESSSESIQAWAGLFLLGEALNGNDPRAADIRAAGAFGYAIETRAVLEYYQDYHGSPYASNPRDYDNKPVVGKQRYPVWPDAYRYGRAVRNYPEQKAWVFTTGIMGDSGYVFGTYFGAQPEFTYGIQWLPNAPHMLFLARDPAFTMGQFSTLMTYRSSHFANFWLDSLAGAPARLRREWHLKPTDKNPDPRKWAIDNPWSDMDMRGIVENLYRLNPAYVKTASPSNPIYDAARKTWLVEFSDDDNQKLVFPAAIWNPETLLAKYPHLVPPQNEKELASYSLSVWSDRAFLPPQGPGVDWKALNAKMGWNPADYPQTPEGQTKSLSQLTTALEDIGGSWPLIALTFAGFAQPELGVAVMEESRKRQNAFAQHTETGMYAYYYFHSLRGLGRLMVDQHVSIPSSLVFLDDKTGARSYMVHNASQHFELATVFGEGRALGYVLAAPQQSVTQHGLLIPSSTFSVMASYPAAGAREVLAQTPAVAIAFSEPVNLATLPATLTLAGPGPVSLRLAPGTNQQVITYNIAGECSPGAAYTAQVPASIKNAKGTSMLSKPFTLTWTVAAKTAAVSFGESMTAEKREWVPGDGKWRDRNRWKPEGIPGPQDDLAISKGSAEYVGGKDLVIAGCLTIGPGGTFFQSGGTTWIQLQGHVIVNGGEFKQGSSGQLNFGTHGAVTLNAGRMILSGTLEADKAKRFAFKGGILDIGNGEFQFNTRLTIRTGIRAGMFASQAPAVLDLLDGHTILSGTAHNSFWQSGTSYVNFTEQSKAVITFAGRTMDDTYKVLFSGDNPRIRYQEKPVSEKEFARLFNVKTSTSLPNGVDISRKK